MRAAVHLVVGSALRFYAPLLTLFAFSLLMTWPANSGVGFAAGAALGMLLILHVLVFGAEGFRAALPPAIARVFLCVGVILALVAAATPGWDHSAQAMEAALCLATVGALGLIVLVLAGRVPTLRDEDW